MSVALRSGVDMVEIGRISGMLAAGGSAFLNDVWTRPEQKYSAGRPDRFASRWAAKEAVMKTLGVGFPDIAHTEIEVIAEPGHRPTLALHLDAAKIASELGLNDWSVSLSHENGLAIAFVVALGGT